MKTFSLAAVLCATAAAAAPTTTTLAQSGSAGDYTLIATVTSVSAAAPTGSISFLDADNGNSVLATAALVPSVTTLGPPLVKTTAVAAPGSIAAADFNGDGILDLAVASGSSVAILLGKGDGTFTAGATLPTSSPVTAVAAGRFRGQGPVDLAVANGLAISIFSNDGTGTFTAGQSLALPNIAFAVTVGSFGRTGADLAATSTGAVSAFLANGDGTFQPAVNTAVAGDPEGIVPASFGAVVTSSATGAVIPLLNAGGGAFTVKASLTDGQHPQAIAAGDFDGDGIADVAVANNGGNTVSLFFGDGSGAFNAGTPVQVGQGPIALAAADFNNDGITDLAVTNGLDGTIEVLLGRGGGAFSPATTVPVSGASTFLLAGDFDKDGHLDLAAAGSAVAVMLTQTQRSAIVTVRGIAPTGIGVHQVVASYPGDGAHDASVSAPTGLTTAPTVTLAPASATLAFAKLGDTVTDAIQINSAGNFSGDIGLTCAVVFQDTGAAATPPICAIDQKVTVAPGTPAKATLTLTSSVASSLRFNDPQRAALFALLCLGLIPKRSRKRGLFLVLFAVLAASSACGNDTGSFATLPTTAGVYRIDLTASGSTFTATTSVSVTVPPQ